MDNTTIPEHYKAPYKGLTAQQLIKLCRERHVNMGSNLKTPSEDQMENWLAEQDMLKDVDKYDLWA